MSIRSSVDARRLDQVIRIEKRVDAPDAIGAPVATWVERVTTPAAADATMVRNAQPFLANEKRGPTAMTFWIRADVVERFCIDLSDRVVWKGRHYDISDMPDQQVRGRLAALIATAGLNQG